MASIGTQFLLALVRDNRAHDFTRLPESLFVDAERPLYNQIRDFHARYQRLPTRAELDRLVEGLPEVGDLGVDSLFDSVRLRYLRAAWQSLASNAVNLLRSANLDSLRNQIAAFSDLTRLDLTGAGSAASLSEIYRRILDEYAQAQRREGLAGVTLGWPTLDRLTDGAKPGDIVTLVGRPGEGKSFAMLYMALAAHRAGKRVLFLSMEMEPKQLGYRLLGMMSNVDLRMLQSGRLSSFGLAEVRAVGERIDEETPFFLLPGDLSKTPADVEHAVRVHRPDIVYIDAAYLMSPNRKTGLRKFEMLEAVGEELKRVAMSAGIPIVQSVQFNRSAVKERDGRALHNIGHTDTVAQISSVVITIAPAILDEGQIEARDFEIIKNRDGQTGKWKTRFSFQPFSMDEIEEPAQNTEWTASVDPLDIDIDIPDGDTDHGVES